MENIESICRLICLKNGINPDEVVYNTQEPNMESPAWMLNKRFVSDVVEVVNYISTNKGGQA